MLRNLYNVGSENLITYLEQQLVYIHCTYCSSLFFKSHGISCIISKYSILKYNIIINYLYFCLLFGINAQKLVKACSVTIYNATFLYLSFCINYKLTTVYLNFFKLRHVICIIKVDLVNCEL